MPRRKQFPPTIYAHKSGNDRIRVDGHDIWLGRSGSPEAKAKYAAIVSRLAQGQPAADPPRASGATVEQVCTRFFVERVERTYLRADGSQTGEVDNYRQTLRPLLRLHGEEPIASLTLSDLEFVRHAMLTGSWLSEEERARRPRYQLTVSRRIANKRMWRILRMLRWAKRHRLLSAETYLECADLEPLPEGAEGAIEHEEVPPVPEADLAATLPYLNHVTRAMVELQLLTGMRPGEIVKLRGCDLDRSGKVEIARGTMLDIGSLWSYSPKWREGRTKTKKGRRIILFGPKAQAILAPFLDREPTAYLFSPREALAVWRAKLRKARKTPVQPSQRGIRKRKHQHTQPSRRPRDHYEVRSYGTSISKTIRRANRAGQTIAHWHPHQLRHNAATRLVDQFGWAVAQTILGHRSLSTTRIYALDSWTQAAEAMRQSG